MNGTPCKRVKGYYKLLALEVLAHVNFESFKKWEFAPEVMTRLNCLEITIAILRVWDYLILVEGTKIEKYGENFNFRHSKKL